MHLLTQVAQGQMSQPFEIMFVEKEGVCTEEEKAALCSAALLAGV